MIQNDFFLLLLHYTTIVKVYFFLITLYFNYLKPLTFFSWSLLRKSPWLSLNSTIAFALAELRPATLLNKYSEQELMSTPTKLTHSLTTSSRAVLSLALRSVLLLFVFKLNHKAYLCNIMLIHSNSKMLRFNLHKLRQRVLQSPEQFTNLY